MANEHIFALYINLLHIHTFISSMCPFYLDRVDGEDVRLMLWDTAGQEEFDAITAAYYRGAHACVLAYSATDRDSFDAIPSWKLKVKNPFALHQQEKASISSLKDKQLLLITVAVYSFFFFLSGGKRMRRNPYSPGAEQDRPRRSMRDRSVSIIVFHNSKNSIFWFRMWVGLVDLISYLVNTSRAETKQMRSAAPWTANFCGRP